MKHFMNFLLFIVDFFHKKKIYGFLKKNFVNSPLIIIDVGAHYGESIRLFFRYFNVEKIFCYEASRKNFEKLNQFTNNLESLKKVKINSFNFGIGETNTNKKFNQTSESSSSTFAKIIFKSKYFKKKNRILKFFFGPAYISEILDIELKTLESEIIKHELKKIDLIKIDTEGYEYMVLKGLKEKISMIKCIYFEHHFDQMIVKNYKFKDIDHLLKKADFKKVFKIKMPFRKTFEYIYVNNKNI